MSRTASAEPIEHITELNVASQPAGHPAVRGQHPKHHGCPKAVFRVRSDVPTELRHGIFAQEGEYQAYVRFSNGRAADDRKADAHGMAIKVLGVTGQKLIDGREHETAQDFVLVDSETFFTGDAADYVRVNWATMGKGIQKLTGWLSILLRPALLLRILQFVSKRPRSPFEARYFSTVPFALGPLVVKYVALPRNPIILGPTQGRDGLAESLRTRLGSCGISFAFALDIQTDPVAQPVENPTIAWSTAGANRVVVADIILPRQPLDPSAPAAENLQFSPWHALSHHMPIGFINEARKPVYREMAKARHTRNGIMPIETSDAPDSYTRASQEDAS